MSADNLKNSIHLTNNAADLSEHIEEAVDLMEEDPNLVTYGMAHWIKEGNKRYYNLAGEFYFEPSHGEQTSWPPPNHLLSTESDYGIALEDGQNRIGLE